MSKTTKIVVLVNVIASVLLAVIIGSTLYAWYVRTSHTETVDVSTNGIVLTYEIDEDDNTVNTMTYSIDNLAFFDIDTEDGYGEAKYFTTMAHVIQIDITNKSKKNVDISLSFVDEIVEDTPYATCIVSKVNTLDSTSCDLDTSVSDYISDNSLVTTQSYTNIAKDSSVTFYVYIYGVQPDDTADNTFLYDDQANNVGETYTFKLRINATVTAGQNAEITEEEISSSTTNA